MTYKLAIFDLDGTLADTDHLNFFAYQQVLSLYDYTLTQDIYAQQINGRNWRQFLPEFLPHATSECYQKIRKQKQDIYQENIHLTTLRTQISDQLIQYYNNNIFTSVVTNASRANAHLVLEHLNIHQYINLILTADDVTQLKPNPEGFVKAMKYFHIKAENTVIYEDSPSGLTAANQTGATVIEV